jgi:hypothetical protein
MNYQGHRDWNGYWDLKTEELDNSEESEYKKPKPRIFLPPEYKENDIKDNSKSPHCHCAHI